MKGYVSSRKAIVIGATSGIGRGVAGLLADDGYTVGITGRRTELLEELRDTKPCCYRTKTMDVRDTSVMVERLDELVAELGGLDLVFISSGWGDLNPSLDFEIEERTIETNVAGFTCVAGWAFNLFEKQGSGHLVAVTSIGGLLGSRHAPAYNASKAYQINYLDALRQKAKHLKGSVHVTDIRPGFVNTAMAKGDGLFWVAPVEKAAKQIVSAIQSKRNVAYVTKRWRIIATALKLLAVNC